MKIYHVCNDLSLDLADTVPARGTVRWVKKQMVITEDNIIEVELGYSVKHNELHYLRTNSDTDSKLMKFRYIK
jgi:hypothetical protein